MKLTADEQILREVLLDLLDSGPASRPRWDFYEDHGSEGSQTEDSANRDRLEFADEVINRIHRAKAPETMEIPGVGRVVTTKGRLLHLNNAGADLPLSAIVPLAVALDRLQELGLIQEEGSHA